MMMPMTSIERPSWHNHPLTCRKLSENCFVKCDLCEQCFNGPTYCCFTCDFFLHESCALMEFPRQLQHPALFPSHPQHTLVLDGMLYRCTDCPFYCDVLEAVAAAFGAPPPEYQEHTDNQKGMIQQYHLSEDNRISTFHLQRNHDKWCNFCRKSRSSDAPYRPCACDCFPKELCAQALQEVQHPLHHQHTLSLQVIDSSSKMKYTCAACGLLIRDKAVYCCSECQFNLDLHCATSISDPQFDQGTEEGQGGVRMAEHFSHPHPLTAFRVKDGISLYIRCQVCEDYVSGRACGCIECRFFLHRSCKEKLLREIQHFLHPQHPLAFIRATLKSKCHSCSKNIDGIAFSCQTCPFDLHPVCALQTLCAVEEGAASPNLPHFAHDHPLALHFFKSPSYDLCCKACEQLVNGLGYGCRTCGNFRVHKSCATLSQELEQVFHPMHPLVLLPEPAAGYFHCSICKKRSTGLSYNCAECGFFLDIDCASLNPTLKHHRHEHRLAYFKEKRQANPWCSFCGHRCERDFYCCVPCNFGLHHDCLPLPPTIQHECHPYHPLVLFDRFVDRNPDDLYCDYCEEIRNPEHGVYRCEKCYYTAHIECIIPAIPKFSPHAGKIKSEEEPEEYQKSQKREIADQKLMIEAMQRTIHEIEGNIESAMEKLKEFERERENELNSRR